jgi:hypothetical protein
MMPRGPKSHLVPLLALCSLITIRPAAAQDQSIVIDPMSAGILGGGEANGPRSLCRPD